METIKNKPSSGPEPGQSTDSAVEQEANTLLPDKSLSTSEVRASDTELDTVRKILFGRQVLETERRQVLLERSIQDAMDAINKEMQKQLQSMQDDLTRLRKEFALEVQKQDVQTQSVAKRFLAVEHSIVKASEQTQKEHHTLEQSLHKETTRLENEISDWRKDIFHQLGQTQQQLQHDKADRKSIAVLLHNMAEQLVENNNNNDDKNDGV